MADIIPFRAWRYNPDKFTDVNQNTAPLFDVISDKKRERLYENPYNSIHLALPKNNNWPEAKSRLNQWKSDGHLLQDTIPCLYPYYQSFTLHNSRKNYSRKGFMCLIKICDWEEEVILRHENFMKKHVGNREKALESMEIMSSPTHGLYHDPNFEIEKLLEEFEDRAIYESEDYQGVIDKMAICDSADIIKKITGLLRDKKILLADGHHRYQASLEIRNKRKAAGLLTGDDPYNYHLIYLTNSAADDLIIFPTHRLLSNVKISDENLIKRIHQYFEVTDVEEPDLLEDLIAGKKFQFGIVTRENAYRLKLKEGLEAQIKWQFPEVIKQLDLTILHYYILEKVFDIPGKVQTHYDDLHFSRSLAACVESLKDHKSDVAIIVNNLSIEEIIDVCYSGYTLPQKSTYFYPKVISGFVFASLNNEEFTAPHNISL